MTVVLAILSVTAFMSAIFWPALRASSDDGPSLRLASLQRRQQSLPAAVTVAEVSVNREFSVVASFLSESASSVFHAPAEDLVVTDEDSADDDDSELDLRRDHDDETVFARTLEPHDPRADRGFEELKFNAEGETDDVESIYAFDDDAKRNPYTEYDDDNILYEKHCRRSSGYRDLPINCNNVCGGGDVLWFVCIYSVRLVPMIVDATLVNCSTDTHTSCLFAAWVSCMNSTCSTGFSPVTQSTSRESNACHLPISTSSCHHRYDQCLFVSPMFRCKIYSFFVFQ